MRGLSYRTSGRSVQTSDTGGLPTIEPVEEGRSVTATPRSCFIETHKSQLGAGVEERSCFWKLCYALFSSQRWDQAIGIIVILNCLFIGAEIDLSDLVPEKVFSVLEITCLVIFCSEVILKFYVFRCLYIKSFWNLFDIFIVVSGVASFLADHYVKLSQSRTVTMFRFTRLLRLVRMIRLTVQFHSIWVIVNGMLNSFYTCASALIVTVSLLYFFGILAVTIMSGDEFEGVLWSPYETVHQRFRDTRNSMLSLSAFFAIDAMSEKGYLLYKAQPLTIFFIVAIVILIPIVLLNLITATLVELCLDKSSDADYRRATQQLKFDKLCYNLEDIFIQILSGTSEGIKRLEQKEAAEAAMLIDDAMKKQLTWLSNADETAAAERRAEAMKRFAGLTLSAEQVEEFSRQADGSVSEVFDVLNTLLGECAGTGVGIRRLLEFWPLLDVDEDGALTMEEFAVGIAKIHWMFIEKGDFNGETMLWMRIFEKQHEVRLSQVEFEDKMLKRMDALSSQVEALVTAQARTQAQLQEIAQMQQMISASSSRCETLSESL
eukprot:TRINITY_DN102272_c0_g1_i1.p1 TRINITY_DN102272_c0_g1~~TRINITY_DN102272_c0_g1_i1.p1  ORF type:complete len:547 (+),score=90.04 TRINITY_DN102272_c0_g1_i1:363-2003(+)